MSKIQTNNTSLEEILETINNLPEAGGSGGGEIYTITIQNNTSSSTKYGIAYFDETNTACSKNNQELLYGESINLKVLNSSIILLKS